MNYQIPPPNPNETYESFVKRLCEHDEPAKQKRTWFKLFNNKRIKLKWKDLKQNMKIT